jgi:hypothetical protein
VGDRVKGSARDPATAVNASQCANTTYDLACRASSEGQQQDPLRCHAAFEKKFDSGGKGCGLAGAGPRDDSERPVSKCGGLSLLVVELSRRSEHPLDVTFGVSQPKY